jgi:hypothetical protein
VLQYHLLQQVEGSLVIHALPQLNHRFPRNLGGNLVTIQTVVVFNLQLHGENLL